MRSHDGEAILFEVDVNNSFKDDHVTILKKMWGAVMAEVQQISPNIVWSISFSKNAVKIDSTIPLDVRFMDLIRR